MRGRFFSKVSATLDTSDEHEGYREHASQKSWSKIVFMRSLATHEAAERAARVDAGDAFRVLGHICYHFGLFPPVVTAGPGSCGSIDSQPSF